MTDERIIAYLLEELTEQESERFENECFAHESWPAQLEVAEEVLIDDYLRGELMPERRLRFERNYLTTAARLERVRMAAALLRHVDEGNAEEEESAQGKFMADEGTDDPGSLGWFRSLWEGLSFAPGTATLALAGIAVAAILITFGFWLTRPLPPSQTDVPPAVATLALVISRGDRAGGAQAASVTLPPGASALNVSLVLPEGVTPGARYRVELENVHGEKKAAEVAGRDTRSVSVLIPAAQLERGQYALKLFVVQTDGTEQRVSGSYIFSID